MRPQIHQSQSQKGYMLFEVIMAVTIFSLAMVGLFKTLQVSAQTSNDFARDTAIRYGLLAILTEAKHRDLQDMNLEQMDEEMEIAYTTEVEAVQMSTEEGTNLGGLYKLKAIATYLGPNGQQLQDTAEMLIYREEENDQ